MSLTNYITLGRSGLRVSPLCLGTMTFGEEWLNPSGKTWGSSPEDSFEILERYLGLGGNFLDTANIYTKGHSEKIIGDYFASGPGKGRRDRAVIATKFCGNMFRGDPNAGGAGRKAIIDQCEHSLRRLQTDYIDLYWVHFWDKHTPIDETMRTLDDLVRSGKVRHIGFSDHPAWVCTKAQYEAIFRGWTPLCALQIEYSLLQRTPEADLIPMAMDMGMGVTPWSPLKSGVLSGKFTRESRPPAEEVRVKDDSPNLTEQAYDVIDALIGIARELKVTPAQVALNWCQTQPGVTSTIIGARTLKQLDDNLGALSFELTAKHKEKLDGLTAFERHFPHDFIDGIRVAVQNGSTVNGVESDEWPLSPEGDEDRY